MIAVEQHAQQFRAIQKRLLTRFKDNTPSSLQHLDTLLDGTFLQVTSDIGYCRVVCNSEGVGVGSDNCNIDGCVCVCYS